MSGLIAYTISFFIAFIIVVPIVILIGIFGIPLIEGITGRKIQ